MVKDVWAEAGLVDKKGEREVSRVWMERCMFERCLREDGGKGKRGGRKENNPSRR